MPDNFGELFADYSSCDMLATSAFYLLIIRSNDRITGIGDDGGLVKSHPQIPITVFILLSIRVFASTIFASGY